MNYLQLLCMLVFHPLQGTTSATSVLIQINGIGLMTHRYSFYEHTMQFYFQIALILSDYTGYIGHY